MEDDREVRALLEADSRSGSSDREQDDVAESTESLSIYSPGIWSVNDEKGDQPTSPATTAVRRRTLKGTCSKDDPAVDSITTS